MTRFAYHRLVRHPYVVMTTTLASLRPVVAKVAQYHARPAFVFAQVWWSLEVDGEQLAREHRSLGREYPSVHVTVLANTQTEVEICRELYIPALLCNHNSFLQDESYAVFDGTRVYDAIYTANTARYKRHYLANEVPSLALVTYQIDETEPSPNELKAELPAGRILNDPARGFQPLTPVQISKYLAKAKVGLCLSAVEGAMFASAEYLLCGLPVVSTPSIGGRDEFFDCPAVRIVPPDSDAIAEAALALGQLALNRQAIRDQTRSAMAQHRERLEGVLSEIAGTPLSWHGDTVPINRLIALHDSLDGLA